MEVVSNVSDNCFAHQMKILNLFGISTNTRFLNKLYTICLLIILTIYPFAVISEIVKLRNDFDELINSLIFEIGYFTSLFIIYCLYWNRFAIHTLFNKIQDLSDLAKSAHNTDGYLFIQNYENFVKKQGYAGTTLACTVLIACIIPAALLSKQTEEWILPFGSGIFIQNGAIRFFLQSFTISVVGILLYSGLFIYINMLVLVSAHYQYLQKCISSILNITQSSENLEERSENENYNAETITWEAFKIKLIKVVDYHTTINEICTDIEKTFNISIFIFFSGISLVLCCLLYHGSTLHLGDVNFFKDLILIIICYSFLLILCFWGDQVLTESGKIASSCYEVDFVGLDIRIQKALLLIQSQKPKKLIIGKIKVLCLPTMVGVFQSIYSYYTFLRNVKNLT